jgi:hypothetical protein
VPLGGLHQPDALAPKQAGFLRFSGRFVVLTLKSIGTSVT